MILHRHPHRVAVATGLQRPSDNRKTGPMVQIWILPRRLDPVKAMQTGRDRVVCGDCPLRKSTCCVRVEQAPLAIWRSLDKYPEFDLSAFHGRRVRFGAYGDPAFLPLPLIRDIAEVAEAWTGYTHQWRRPEFQGYKAFLMASCETEADANHARSLGWRTYRIAPEPGPGEIACPSARGVSCFDCRLCAGTSKSAKSITIPQH